MKTHNTNQVKIDSPGKKHSAVFPANERQNDQVSNCFQFCWKCAHFFLYINVTTCPSKFRRKLLFLTLGLAYDVVSVCGLGLALLFLPLGGVKIEGHFVMLTKASMQCGLGSIPNSTP